MSGDQSSIQRFLQNRGHQIFMGSFGRTGMKWHIVGGAICILIGTGLLIAGALTGIRGLLFGSIGPWVAGLINIGIGIAHFARNGQAQNEPRLTPEARTFLWGLMKQTNTPWGGHQQNKWAMPTGHGPLGANHTDAQENSFLSHLGKQWGFIPKTVKDLLPRPVFVLLDTACFHYNRVFGILEAGKSDNGLLKVASTAKAGADEAIFAILHHAATMHRYPETISAASRDCEDKIRALKELADGLEKIQIRPTSISDRLGYTSALDSALDEIRLEQLARQELHSHGQEEDHLRDRL